MATEDRPGPEPGPEAGPEPVSVPLAARALGISERAVRKRIAAGTLRAEPFGRSYRVWLPGVDLENVQPGARIYSLRSLPITARSR